MKRTLAAVFAVCCLARPAAAAVLDQVRTAGTLRCGLVVEENEYNKDDRHGGLAALGTEICKAVAAATLGDAAKLRLLAYPSELEGLTGLAAGEADLLLGATPSASNLGVHKVGFGPPVFFDAQGFMVNRASGISGIRDLAGRTVCFIDGTDYQPTLAWTMQAHGIAYVPFPFQEEGEMDAALMMGRCDAETADQSKLAEKRAAFRGRAGQFVLLPELLTLDPVAPAYAQGDPQWAAVVDWTVYALLQAEAGGVTHDNIASMRGSDDPTVQALLGVDAAAGRALGLPSDWAAKAIAAVGNYGEIYARTVGPGTPLNLPRGLNALWRHDGLMRPLPVR